MTINDLTIDDTAVDKFKRTCAEHYQRGGARICQKARTTFFSELRHEYGLEHIKPHLRDLFVQLERWEVEVRSNGNGAAA